MTRATAMLAAALLAGAVSGCDRLPGKPRLADREPAFGVLYRDHCAGCHGADGRLGPSRPLNDAVYLALVPRERLRAVVAEGVPGTAQPAFARAAGGPLTDAQIDALVGGVLDAWARRDAAPLDAPPYAVAAGGRGDAGRGAAVYRTACARCHERDGAPGPRAGPVRDPSYLALVSDQYLRTAVIAGRPDLGMPDWRGYVPDQPLTDQQVSDVVAWLVAARRPVAGRP
jgi:mono/diheme cytochrome c family protein